MEDGDALVSAIRGGPLKRLVGVHPHDPLPQEVEHYALEVVVDDAEDHHEDDQEDYEDNPVSGVEQRDVVDQRVGRDFLDRLADRFDELAADQVDVLHTVYHLSTRAY